VDIDEQTTSSDLDDCLQDSQHNHAILKILDKLGMNKISQIS